MPFVVVIALRYGRRARPALQEVQQRIAELTAEVEENISGVRVVKAFAREDRQLERFRASNDRVFDQAMISTRLQRLLQPADRVPAAARAGGRAAHRRARVINGSLSLGDFTAFYAYLLLLLSPMRTLGMSLGMAQRATASGARLFEILDRAPRIAAPRRMLRPLPAGSGA